MTGSSILWRRLDRPGHEAACLRPAESLWLLVGCAVFDSRGLPVQLQYEVICDSAWRTVSTSVTGSEGTEPIGVRILVDEERRWTLNGRECDSVNGCFDVDLNFSPSTNLLPVRRLGLAVGEEAQVRAAWLRFPQLILEPLAQTYRRTDESHYEYSSRDGSFVRKLAVNRWVLSRSIRISGAWKMVDKMTTRATGTFHVKLTPPPADDYADGAQLGRMTIDKQFHGDLEATSKGQMLTGMSSVKGSAGYVAIERVEGVLAGRRGTFLLQHTGSMNRGAPTLTITVVPDSGTDQLAGLSGTMGINVAGEEHSYTFEYSILEDG